MKRVLLAAGIAASASLVWAQETKSPEGAEVYFIGLEDGASVSSPVTLHFGLKGMGVAPAGTERENTGHHHLLLNRPPLGEGEGGAEEFEYSMPGSDNLIHFGGGQTETTLELAPGTHTLQLVLGDAAHVPHDPPVLSERITIVVE